MWNYIAELLPNLSVALPNSTASGDGPILGCNYSIQVSQPRLWLYNVDRWDGGRGNVAALEGFARTDV